MQTSRGKRAPLARTIRFFMITVFLSVLLEESGLLSDPWAALAWHYDADLSSWIPIRIVVSPLEISVIIIFAIWWFSRKKLKGRFNYQRVPLDTPVLVFAGAIAFSFLNGMLAGGDNTTIALWEIRGFLMMITIYFLTGILIRDDHSMNQLVWAIFIGATGLAIENIYRRFAFSALVLSDPLAYDHIDSVMLGCAIVLAIALFTFGGTRAQRRFAAFALPVWFFSTLVMERRAAFPVIGIGIVVLAIFIIRLRPRLFWTYAPPIIILSAIYLAIFWNNTGTLGQPARALSSMITPDPRDYASNLYRALEKLDILANVQAHPIFGLGFGQQYIFYTPLPNLSFWPFWHYMSHNADLWVWMKMGAIGFIIFWWLIGRAAYDGSVVVETQRQEWNVVAALMRRLKPRNGSRGNAVARKNDVRMVIRTESARSRRGKMLGLNTPVWQRSAERNSKTALPNASLALLVTSICMIPMQIVYSYVDLGLTSERDMLLFGLMIGLLAHGYSLLGVKPTDGKKRTATRTRKLSDSEILVTEVEDFLRELAPTRTETGKPQRKNPISPALPTRTSNVRPEASPQDESGTCDET